MRGLFKVLLVTLIVIVFSPLGQAWAQGKRDPDVAYDFTNNRYLRVWEEDDGSGHTNIKARFFNPDGSVGSGTERVISVDRTRQGCFYEDFDSQNGDITTPGLADCSLNKNPSVAYNNGQYIVVWEVQGTAGSPASAPDNKFINIFAQVIDANSLDPLPGWSEGILISKVFIAANNLESHCGDRHACNDGQILAWSQSINPDVAPNLGGQGFVVTWQSNKDFIGCADPDRRRGWAVYGRYIDQNFSATSTTNPPAFSVFKDDSTMMDTCEPATNVDNGANPRIAVNQTSNDFVIAFEVARASGGNASIGAKRVTLDGSNVGQVNGSLMPDIVAAVSGTSLNNPDIVSFKGRYVVFASDGSDIRAKSFDSSSISVSDPTALTLGSGSKINPRAVSNLGIGGQRGATPPNASPERILLAYEKGGDIFDATLGVSSDGTISVTRAPSNASTGVATANRAVEVASDVHNFIATWNGQSGGDDVFMKFISSDDSGTPTPTPNVAPTAPGLLLPNDMATFAPLRANLSWNASSDTDGGTITYRIYFGETAIPATPQVTGVTATHFVIGPETQAMTGITLQASKVYKWKVEADDGQGGLTSSPVRTLNTDNSLQAWWRFDENPAGPVCPGGAAGETVCDYSGNNNHGVPSGGPTWLPPPMPGILGGALTFDGIDDKVNVAHDSTLNLGATMTVTCKINSQHVATNTSIVTKDNPAQGPYVLTQTSSDLIAWEVDTGGVFHSAVGNALAFFGTQLRVFGVYTGASVDLYFGSVLQDSVGAPGSVTNNTNSVKIGFSAFSNSFYKGTMDECIIVSKILNSVERQNLLDSD